MDHPWVMAAFIQPTIRPTEYRCYIKEVNPIWRSGCGYPIADGSPSSVTQLPITDSTSRRVSYSVPDYYTRKPRKCK